MKILYDRATRTLLYAFPYPQQSRTVSEIHCGIFLRLGKNFYFVYYMCSELPKGIKMTTNSVLGSQQLWKGTCGNGLLSSGESWQVAPALQLGTPEFILSSIQPDHHRGTRFLLRQRMKAWRWARVACFCPLCVSYTSNNGGTMKRKHGGLMCLRFPNRIISVWQVHIPG